MRGRGKESPHLSRYEQGNDIPVVQMDYAFWHDTSDKEAKVTFLTMVDNSSGQIVATAVQCEGVDIVQSDHAPEAGVAQGIFHGDLIRHQDGHQEELEEELEEEVERRVRRDHSSNQTQVRMHG